ncbi:MAG: hypothetical protein HY067_10610 [Betaproteobacteria bacterium]|nr:hypothetical protein [Betaproteobacteria bacterium]
MARGKLEFIMPAKSADAFEAFFNHNVRLRWDTLLNVTYVEGGGSHPYVGAVSTNVGLGWKTWLSMRTRFLSYNPPPQASAEMVEPTGPFALWAASMRFRDRGDGGSDLIYTYSIKLRPKWLGAILDPMAGYLFARETSRRFAAMARYLGRQRSHD